MKSLRMKSALALVMAASLGLAACSSDAEETTTDGGNETSEASEDTSADETTEATDEVVEIEYLHRLPDGDGMVKVSETVDRWNAENPNIQVTATKFDGVAQDLIKKLETDVAAGNAACLAQVGYGEIPETYVKGILEDVTAEAEQYKGDFAEGPFALMGVDGKIFGIPQDTGPLVYYYNKAAFDELGIELPTNAEELQAAAEKAAAEGKYIMSFQPDEAGYGLSAMAAAAGDSWFTVEGDGWNVDAAGAGSSKVAETWQGLLDADAALTAPRWDPSFDKALTDGVLIGTIGAAWEAPLIQSTLAEADSAGQWQVAQLGDWFGNGTTTGPDGGSGVAVIKGCEHPAEAMAFNAWFNTQIDDLASQGLVVAASTGTPATPEAVKEFYGGQDVMAELLKANDNMSTAFGYMPGFSSVAPAMTDAASKAVDGSGKVMDVFTAANDQAKKTLTDMGLKVNN